MTIGDLLVHKAGWNQDVFNPGRRSTTIVPAVAESGMMSGWRAPSGKGLLPMVAADKFRYMLRAEAFQNYDDPDSALDWVNNSTGWRAFPPYTPGDEPGAYAGWHYGLLGAVIELLAGAFPVDGRSNFGKYIDVVHDKLLLRVDARKPIPARQSRYFGSRDEVVYPTAPYMQYGSAPVDMFWNTVMFSPRPGNFLYSE